MKELIRFQTDRNLDKKPFDLLNETSNVFEELLEAAGLDVPKANRPRLKEALNSFVTELVRSNIATNSETVVTNAEQVDAFNDIIVFAVGSILKLGHDPLITVTECGKEVNSRVGTMGVYTTAPIPCWASPDPPAIV